MKIPVVIALVALIALLRWRKASLFTWVLAFWVGFYVAIAHGFTVPIPSSVIMIYMGIATAAVLAYVTSSQERRAEFARPLVRVMTEPKLTPLLAAFVIGLPALAAANVYFKMTVPVEPPLFSRTIHPAAPTEITVHDKKIDIDGGVDPFWELEKTNPEEFKRRVEAGRATYYKNCVFCHGDNLAGTGMFVHGLDPIPTNLADHSVIANLRDTFLFWRIAKGGPGMPEEGGPWDSAMPAWEKFLTEEEMWEVILFIYEFSGARPRAREHEATEH
jgi:mono/diheme cytochrome c family protein